MNADDFVSWKAKLQDLDQAKQESHIVSMAKNHPKEVSYLKTL